MRNLYHYTSIEVLNKILDGKKLRFTQIDSLSDMSEYEYGLKLLQQKIEEYERLNHLKDKFDTSLLDRFSFLNSLCSISFTENKDDYSFWNSYYVPKEGAIAIGFKKDIISLSKSFIVNKCIYGDPYPLMSKERYEWFRAIFDLRNIQEIHKNREYIHITFQTAHIKNPIFAIENEWRAVSFLPSEKEQSEFTRNGKSIRCFDQSFNINSIVEIIIGPSISQEQTYTEIERLTIKHGIVCKIIKSDMPFRP